MILNDLYYWSKFEEDSRGVLGFWGFGVLGVVELFHECSAKKLVTSLQCLIAD